VPRPRGRIQLLSIGLGAVATLVALMVATGHLYLGILMALLGTLWWVELFRVVRRLNNVPLQSARSRKSAWAPVVPLAMGGCAAVTGAVLFGLGGAIFLGALAFASSLLGVWLARRNRWYG